MSLTLPQKPRRLRDRRRRQRIVAFCICLLSAVGMIGGLGAASHAERFSIHEVTVTGTQALSTEVIQDAVRAELTGSVWKLFSRENMFLYPKREMQESLEESFPRISSVKVSRPSLLAQAIVVTISEREPYARWCKDTCYFLDSNGYIFSDDAPGEPKARYEFRGGLIPGASPIGQYFLRGRIDEVVRLLHTLERADFHPKGATVLNEKDFLVPLEEGASLVLSFDADASIVVHNLETALEADALRDALPTLEYIDLRFGNRVYYKTSLKE